MFNWFLRNVLDVSLFKRSLSDVFDPWGSNRRLVNEFNIVSFNWGWLVDLDMFDLIRIRNDDLNDLFFNVLNLIVFSDLGLNDWCISSSLVDYWNFCDDSVVIEWVVVIEVLVRNDWGSPLWVNHRSFSHNDEVIVWVGVVEVGVVKLDISDSVEDSWDGWHVNDDWEIVHWISVIEV